EHERDPRWHPDHDARRDANLLQGLGRRSARGLQPRLAAQRRRLGEPDALPGAEWLPNDSPRPPRSRPLGPPLGRKRVGHLRRRPRPALRGARPARRRHGRPLHRRRGGDPIHRPPRHLTGRQGRAGERDTAADAQDRSQPRRPADRRFRRAPRRPHRRPLAVLQGSCLPLLRGQQAGIRRLPGRPGRLLVPERAGRAQERLRVHKGVLRDRPHGGPQKVRRADPDRPRRRRPDRADSRLGATLVEDRRRRNPEDLRRRAARSLRNAQGPAQRRPADVHPRV
ncbi:MAG: Non-heme chloroperoxidase, partial [uncultured Rubrobacteraceae bacterium]